jgi:hypothetical protein
MAKEVSFLTGRDDRIQGSPISAYCCLCCYLFGCVWSLDQYHQCFDHDQRIPPPPIKSYTLQCFSFIVMFSPVLSSLFQPTQRACDYVR